MKKMKSEKKVEAKKNRVVVEKLGQKVPLNKYYEYSPSEPKLNLAYTKYVNAFTGNVSNEDVFIDFIELPGRKVGGVQTIDGCRLYFTHNAAKTLCDLLHEIVKQIESNSDEKDNQGNEPEENQGSESEEGGKNNE